jgi:hypothetical protein
LNNVGARFVAISIARTSVYPFHFERGEEAFEPGIVPDVTLGTRAARDAVSQHPSPIRAMFLSSFLLYATALVLGWASVAHAQSEYPSRTIKIIAPSQPGGGVDLVARKIGDLLSRAFGQPVGGEIVV